MASLRQIKHQINHEMSLTICWDRIEGAAYVSTSCLLQRNRRSTTFEPSFLIVIIDCIPRLCRQKTARPYQEFLLRGDTFLDHTQSLYSASLFLSHGCNKRPETFTSLDVLPPVSLPTRRDISPVQFFLSTASKVHATA